MLLGIVVIPVAMWISRRYADRLEESPFLQQLMRDIAGRNLAAATEFLRSLVEFEEEQPVERPS